jgi:hypothetical protein
MRGFGLVLTAATLVATAAAGADGRVERSLKMLAPTERLEQLCDYTAMTRIREQNKGLSSRPRGGECDGGTGHIQ